MKPKCQSCGLRTVAADSTAERLPLAPICVTANTATGRQLPFAIPGRRLSNHRCMSENRHRQLFT
jgi:hypothetical protein